MHPVDMFFEIAALRPSALAVSDDGMSWDYARFCARVKQIASALGAEADDRILIALGPSVDAYAAIFASLASGATHTPVNVSAPLAKLQKIAALLDPHVVVAERSLAENLSGAVPNARIVVPSQLNSGAEFTDLGRRSTTAYIMFTSGSTGQPKGVVVPASGLANYVNWCAVLGCQEGDRVSQQPNLGFDISMTDIFGALCYGAALVPLVRDVDRLMPARFIRREKITVWNSTPSAVGLMMTARQLTSDNIETLRLINFCGEALMGEVLAGIFAAAPNMIVQNTYGPTEATIAVTCLRLTKHNYARYIRNSVAIGSAIAGMSLCLVGGPNDDEGEIVIIGPQLANGYWQDPQKTQQAFRLLPMDGQAVTAYFTGDWAVRHEGEIYFRERLDFQVKVDGHRVELDEVAAAIRSLGWVVVSAFKRGEGISALVEHVDGLVFDETQVKVALKDILDKYAIPDRILAVDRVPRNDNDKIDRRAAAIMADDILSRKGAR